jgi:cytidine deaminase
MTKEELVAKAFEGMKNAYAPYSNYHVGAAVEMKDGTTFIGANIENASYGATNCAERSALFAAYSHGYRKEDVLALAVVSDGKKRGSPCGICRQVMSELLQLDTPIYGGNFYDPHITETTIVDLLPNAFTLNIQETK